MDISIRNITLDFYNNTMITVNAKQCDHKLRGILATVSENGVPVVLDSSKVSAYVRCKKPDNTVVFDKCEIDSDGKIYIELTSQILACAGRLALDIIIVESITKITYQKIISSGVNVISTMTMYLNVVENVFPDEYVESKDEFSALKYALARAEYNYQHVLDQAEEYVDSIKSSEEFVTVKANEASISATSASASEINTKIYADNASSSANSAKVSENNVKTYANNADISAKNAKASELLAKEYMERAFDKTPDGYNANMELLRSLKDEVSSKYAYVNVDISGGDMIYGFPLPDGFTNNNSIIIGVEHHYDNNILSNQVRATDNFTGNIVICSPVITRSKTVDSLVSFYASTTDYTSLTFEGTLRVLFQRIF